MFAKFFIVYSRPKLVAIRIVYVYALTVDQIQGAESARMEKISSNNLVVSPPLEDSGNGKIRLILVYLFYSCPRFFPSWDRSVKTKQSYG